MVSRCPAIKKTCNDGGSGRVRNERRGSLTIDIGILAYGDETIKTYTLKIPHPEKEKHNFVLLPLLKLSSEWVHPKTGSRVRNLWEKWREIHDEMVPQCMDQKNQSS